MTDCCTCGQPQRKLWAWDKNRPQWLVIRAANFLALVKCPECASNWLEAAYEPFAAFLYAVRWPYDEDLFARTMSKDSGLTLSRWHEAEIAHWQMMRTKQPWPKSKRIIEDRKAT